MNRLAGALTGRFTAWIVIVFWVAVTAVATIIAGPGGSNLPEVEKNDQISWLPGEAESTKASERLSVFYPPDQLPTFVVYERTEGLTPDDFAKAKADAEEFATFEGVDMEVRGPIPSEDGQALQIFVPLNLGSEGWEKAVGIVDDMRELAGESEGLEAHVTGPGGMAADSGKAFEGIDTNLLLATVVVVVVILLLTYRSPVLWLLPLISAGVALSSAQAVIYLAAKHADLTVNAQSAGILTVLVFGAGTDYALLLVARYREELRRHRDPHQAMTVALHRAGPAIFASAGTVVMGMLCLVFAETNSTKGLGPVAAIGVAVGLLAMVTLLPALLVILGRWIFWPKIPREGSEEPTAAGVWAKIGTSIARRPRLVWVVTTVILGAACLGVVRLDANGLSNDEQYIDSVDSVVGAEVVAAHYDAGSSDPAQVVMNADSAGAVTERADVEGVASVGEPVVNGGDAFIDVTLADQPDSQAAYQTIERLRTSVHSVEGAGALVGGTTAIVLDAQEAASNDNQLIIPLILLVVFLILALLLRALVAPLVLIATVVLSFGAALGISALVFKYVFGFGGADASLPLYVFVFLVALGIDYNIFLMTRVREEAIKFGARRGAIVGLAATGGVITSAGLVLAGTFAVLGTLPLVAFAEIGFAVALGVLLDTIVVRSVLVTALNLDVGRHMWWPSSLAKKQDVDVEELRGDERVAVS